MERLAGHMSHDDRIFSTREQERRLLELSSGFTDYEDRFRFELLEIVQVSALGQRKPMAVDRVPQVRVVTVAQGQQVQPTVVDQLADVGVLLENRVDSIGWSLDEDVEPEGFVN